MRVFVCVCVCVCMWASCQLSKDELKKNYHHETLYMSPSVSGFLLAIKSYNVFLGPSFTPLSVYDAFGKYHYANCMSCFLVLEKVAFYQLLLYNDLISYINFDSRLHALILLRVLSGVTFVYPLFIFGCDHLVVF